ncbi:unnamed protein product, partial [Mesorhabditis belari]|uniref:Uncharacterized protein n=1 Tax=Mesorhabditis belari TaxID=2138241 RepID=A0AAF3ENZ4_9BILA
MVAINLGDSAKKEKPPQEQLSPPSPAIEKPPILQLYETCSENGGTIFRTTIFIQVTTLALFIRLVYCVWTFHYVRHLLGLIFSILGVIVLGYSNTLAKRAYYKTNESRWIRMQYMVLMLLLGLNIPIIILIWTVGFDELIEWNPAPLVMLGLPMFVPLQAYAIVVWRNIEKKMIAGEDHRSIAFYDQANKWKEQLYVEVWTIEPGTKTEAPTPNQHINQYHKRVLINGVLLFKLTIFADLATLGMFIIMVVNYPDGFIRYHQGYMIALTSVIGVILFITVNTPALCAYYRTKKSRHATFKYNSVMSITALTTVIIFALCARGGYFFQPPVSLGLVLLVPIQLYSGAICMNMLFG